MQLDGGQIHTQASRHFDLHPQAAYNHVTRSISSRQQRASEGQQLETAPHPWEPFKDLDLSLPPWNPEIHTHRGGSQGQRRTLVYIWTCTPERGNPNTHISCTNRVGLASESPGKLQPQR